MVESKNFFNEAVKFFVKKDGREAGRAFLYFIKNDLHNEVYGLIEDVFVDEEFRHQGLGSELLNKLLTEAKNRKCYKILATSRNERKGVHSWYEKFGFKKHGVELRLDLN